MTLPYKLAASSAMVFLDLPHIERVRRIHELGFAVEIWDWTKKNAVELLETGAHFTSMTGYVTGSLADEQGGAELLRTAELSIEFAHKLGNPLLNLHGTGLNDRGLPVKPVNEVTTQMWQQAEKTLSRIAQLGAREGVMFALENLNLEVDHPGVPFASAKDAITLVRQINSPHLKVMLDLYHAQIGEGNLISLVSGSMDVIGEIQVADVPGRCEPGTGEIFYPAIAKVLSDLGYSGTVGLESWASESSELALDRFKAAFSLVDQS